MRVITAIIRSNIIALSVIIAAIAVTVVPTASAQVAARSLVQDFVPPSAGSYKLPPITDSANGWVLEGSYFPRRLSQYTHGAITLLTFMYTYCADPVGCPLAYATMQAVRRGVLSDPRLKGLIRFVSLSFDPTNDTPAAMRAYGASNSADESLPWHFLTTYSMFTLTPILEGFGQDIEIARDREGRATRAVTHMLKMFLIDRDGKIREIYSAAFLQPDVILNDLRTLAMEPVEPAL